MSYLTRLSAHTLKIDQSLVRGVRGRHARRAPRLEHRADGPRPRLPHGRRGHRDRGRAARCSTSWGCDFGQGWHFGRPMTAPAFGDWHAGRGRRRRPGSGGCRVSTMTDEVAVTANALDRGPTTSPGRRLHGGSRPAPASRSERACDAPLHARHQHLHLRDDRSRHRSRGTLRGRSGGPLHLQRDAGRTERRGRESAAPLRNRQALAAFSARLGVLDFDAAAAAPTAISGPDSSAAAA